MKYFECNLGMYSAEHMDVSIYMPFKATVRAIEARTQKLQQSLEASGLDGSVFAKFAKIIFDASPERFEAMTATELSSVVIALNDGNPVSERFEWPNTTVLFDTAFVITKEWEMLRHIGIGGSDSSVIAGLSPYRTVQELYHDKCGTPILIPDDGKQAIFERGHILEEKVINTFCKLTGAVRIPETRMFASKKYPHCTANIDAIVQFSDGRIYVFEGKTTHEFNRSAWSNDKVPAYYVTQMRQYPAVLDDDRVVGTYIGCLPTSDFVIADDYVGSTYELEKYVVRIVDRDKDMEDDLLRQEEEFWVNSIEANVEPAPCGKPKDDITLLRRITGYADTDADDLEFDRSEFEATIKEYLAIGEERKALEKRAEGLKDRQEQLSIPLISALGNTVRGIVDIDGSKYYEVKFSPRGKTSTDLDKLQIAFPDAYNACVTKVTENSRVFSLKEKNFTKKEIAARAQVGSGVTA